MKNAYIVTAMLLCALSLAGAPAQAAPAQQATGACDGGDGVYLYDASNYQGRCIKITGDVPDLSAVNFNDTASSVRIVGDWITSLFEHRDYAGASSFFTRSDSNLANNTIGDNRVSSVGARRGNEASVCDGDEGVYLYDQLNYRGRCVRVTDSHPDLSAFSFNNIVSSIRFVGDGWTAALYVDQNYGGARSVFTRDDPDLRNNTVGDNSASSIGVSRSDVPEQDNCNGGEGVYLYEHPNYQGRCLKLTIGSADLRTVGFDDMASSIRMVGGWTATLYRDLSGTGIASTFTGDDPNLADNAIGDNQTTSISVQHAASTPASNACNGGEGVYLYEHPNYQGRCAKFTAGSPDLRTVGFDDIASSIRIVGRWTATLYRDLSGTGIASTFTGNDPNLANDSIGDNQATSIQVGRAVPTADANACDGGAGVYLYEHPNYQGRCVKFTIGAPDLRVLGFDDIASSIRMVGRWTATLYRDLSGTGIASTFTGDDPNLIDNPVGDNQVTSVQVQRR